MLDRILKVYVASPLGRSEATRSWYRETLLPALAACGVEVLDPWAEGERPEEESAGGPDAGSIGERVSAWRDVNARIGLRNTRLIHQAHGLVAVLDGADVDSGTAAEIG
ncbi:MAG: nucleoside 2-deoxyribosyltransferase, partial [candidate division NC10 bacterium]